MKKILALAVVALMLALALVLPVSAAETPELTVAEAEALIAEMDELYWKLQRIPEHIDRDKDVFSVEYGEKHEWGYSSVVAWKPGYSFSDLVAETEGIYTNDIDYDMLALTRTLYYVDGEVVMTTPLPQWDPYNVNGDGLELSDGMNKDDFTISAKVEIDSENVATIEFNYIHMEHPYENGTFIKRSSVTAEYEDGKWQISGGDYIDILAEYHSHWDIIYPNSAPQTGFATAIYAAVAVVSAAAVVAVGKKRK